MKRIPQSIALLALLSGLGLSGAVFAHGDDGAQHHGHDMMEQPDPAKMQARMEKHLAELKAKLKLSSAQEGSWNTFVSAMKPGPGAMPVDHKAMYAEMEKLSTPERLDKMRSLRTEHEAQMDKHAQATKAFYATLTPEQQKVFDRETLRHGHDMMHKPGKKD